MQKINFQNLPNTTTPINATNLNAMQDNTETAINSKVDASSLSTVATSGNYNDLSNKPTIPTVNNGTLTLKVNNANAVTFTANQSGNSTFNVDVPTLPSTTTGTGVVTRTSGATLSSSEYRRYGNVVQLVLECNTTTSTNAGSNCFAGTINNSALIPKIIGAGISYSASSGLIGSIDTSGNIVVRVVGANLATSRPFNISFIYVI